jgi:hypothetical protein
MIVNVIKRLIENQKKHKGVESDWAFDMHGCVIEPNHKKGCTDMAFYPYAKETMQLLSER